MSFAKVFSAQTNLLAAHIIDVEVDISKGLHAFAVVGLPDKAVEESRDRVSAAIKNSGFTSPKSKNQKIVISLAPADLKKEGPLFDLPIALAYLRAADETSFEPDGKLFLGELSLDGELRPVSGVLPLVRKARDEGFREVFVPEGNAREAALIDDIVVYPARTLTDILYHLDEEHTAHLSEQPKTEIEYHQPESSVSFGDIRGQESAKRGLLIAAAGGHNIALYGPPGTGKTMLARAFVNILPELPFEDILEVTSIHSVAGTLSDDLITHPPFRAPHHTSSYVSVVGGGTFPKPGEVTLAHKGVLFLDEFAEFERRVIDAMRQPLEDRVVNISRIKGSASFPANFILVAAMNPCPCGNFGSDKECVCAPAALMRYQRKISGPIIDRIDMWIEVPHIAIEKLREKRGEDTETEEARESVVRARARQMERGDKINSELSVRDIENLVELTPGAQETLEQAAAKLDLSPRSYHRVIKLARTIADLDMSDDVEESHILEALQYRPKSVLP